MATVRHCGALFARAQFEFFKPACSLARAAARAAPRKVGYRYTTCLNHERRRRRRYKYRHESPTTSPRPANAGTVPPIRRPAAGNSRVRPSAVRPVPSPCPDHRPTLDAVRGWYLPRHHPLHGPIPLRTTPCPLCNPRPPSQRRLRRTDLPGHSQAAPGGVVVSGCLPPVAADDPPSSARRSQPGRCSRSRNRRHVQAKPWEV